MKKPSVSAYGCHLSLKGEVICCGIALPVSLRLPPLY